MRVTFLGTGAFARPALSRLAERHDVVLVVTQPDRPAGRHAEPSAPPVKDEADLLALPLFQPERINTPESVSRLRSAEADILVVAAYGQLLKPEVLNAAPRGAVNIHASLLPAYRGAAPIQWAIRRGESQSGSTTFQLDRGMDTGPLLLQKPLDIGPDETAGEVERRMAVLGADLILETLAGLETGSIVPRLQPEHGVSLAPRLTKDDGHVDWTRTAAEVHNLVRGTSPWPGAWTSLSGERIKLLRSARTGVATGRIEPGSVGPREARQLLIACADQLLEIVEVQREGRPRTTGREFLNGMRSGARFE
ncbi:MAG: methionyl-tRNA formyltransferase [Candidatus Bipolaricaulota bacterium]|nr:methionyl-tRNA formyltransferase [Candidatus Bipolaricaulota bacterium]